MDILLPPAGRGLGVLVVHPWWGLNQTIRDYGAALAREGFVVGLADVFAGTTTTSIEEAEQLIRQHWEAAGERVSSALRELAGHKAVTGPGIAALGFSFGGFHLLARLGEADLPLQRLVVYYATHPLPAAHVPVLAHFAGEDAFEIADDVAAMSKALATGPLNATYTYPGTRHWFAEADRPEYDAGAATLAFKRSVAFLRAGPG